MTPILPRKEIQLRGLHNVENLLAACAAVWGRVPIEAMRQVGSTFTGVEHRIEPVRTLDGVTYYNDSIASSPTRTIAGLRSFDQKIILIAGGYDKKIPYEPLAPEVLAHVKTLVLMGAALAMMTDAGRSAMLNPGPHGFSEVLYAVSSAANNNGSAFAGLSANSPFWNCLLAFCMFVGRFGVIIPVMAIAGSLVSKKSQPASSGTLPTHGPLFVGLLIGTVLLVGALTFIPALALGPVAEYLS